MKMDAHTLNSDMFSTFAWFFKIIPVWSLCFRSYVPFHRDTYAKSHHHRKIAGLCSLMLMFQKRWLRGPWAKHFWVRKLAKSLASFCKHTYQRERERIRKHWTSHRNALNKRGGGEASFPFDNKDNSKCFYLSAPYSETRWTRRHHCREERRQKTENQV